MKPKPAYKESKKMIHFGAIPYRVLLILSNDVRSARSGRMHILGDWNDTPDTVAIHVGVKNEALSYIFLPYESDIGYVAHEAFHTIWRLMEHIGAMHENEIMAYHLGFLVREITKFIHKHEICDTIKQP